MSRPFVTDNQDDYRDLFNDLIARGLKPVRLQKEDKDNFYIEDGENKLYIDIIYLTEDNIVGACMAKTGLFYLLIPVFAGVYEITIT